jgi:Importin-beta N-terminal domain
LNSVSSIERGKGCGIPERVCTCIANKIMFSYLVDAQERKAAEDSLKACQTSAGYTDVLIAIVSSDASSAIRLVAVIILRSMIKSNWKATRSSNIRVVTTEEKQRIREFLIGPAYCNEAEDSVAVQIAVTTAKVTRFTDSSRYPSHILFIEDARLMCLVHYVHD